MTDPARSADDVREEAVQRAAWTLALLLNHTVADVQWRRAGPNTVSLARSVINAYEDALTDGGGADGA